MANPSKAKGTARLCACGCGKSPKNWSAEYVAGHRPKVPVHVRLWNRVDVGWDCECWEWQGYRNRKGRQNSAGYGQIGLGSKEEGVGEVHRLAYEFFYGAIPAGMVIRHRCDNPPCCNPHHLVLGTQADNVRDAVERKRVAREFALPQTKLSDEQVREIRQRYNPQFRRYIRGWASNVQELADEYGIHPMHLSAIVHGRERANV